MALIKTKKSKLFRISKYPIFKNKKGVFFTFVAVLFLALLMYASTIGSNYELRQKSFVTETRVDTMDTFVSDVERDLSRAAYIVGFRSLVVLTEEIISTGFYVSDLNYSFNELFFNGTLNGANVSLLINNTFNDWTDKIEFEAEKIDIEINFTINNVSLAQETPWFVRLNVDVEMDFYDTQYGISWNNPAIVSAYIDLDGFNDPVYMVETNGLVERSIKKTIQTDFTNGADISNLLNHTYEHYYIEFPGAPSYLMRLQGDLDGESEYGIESLVDIADLISKGVSDSDKSIVDYIYFSSNNPTDYHVTGAPSWFKIDNNSNMYNSETHLELYEVTSLT